MDNYETGLERLTEKHLPGQYDRSRHLIGTALKMMKHFFDRSYGEPDKCTLETIPKYWPFVRSLVEDNLLPKWDAGETEYANHDWNDKFLNDITEEANELTKMLPSDLTNDEWIYIVGVASHMLLENPLLIEHGYINQKGREQFRNQAVVMGMCGDGYRRYFQVWKERGQ